ncbi:MAG: nitrate/nitrite transporter NrtS [Pseudomonadota bacterium]
MTNATVPERPSLMNLIFGGGTPRRAFFTALVVGTILTLINHGDTALAGQLPPLAKILLTYCVPYCVATWGAMGAKLALYEAQLQAQT